MGGWSCCIKNVVRVQVLGQPGNKSWWFSLVGCIATVRLHQPQAFDFQGWRRYTRTRRFRNYSDSRVFECEVLL